MNRTARLDTEQRLLCPYCEEKLMFRSTWDGLELACRFCCKTFSPEEVLAKNGDIAEEVFGNLRADRL